MRLRLYRCALTASVLTTRKQHLPNLCQLTACICTCRQVSTVLVYLAGRGNSWGLGPSNFWPIDTPLKDTFKEFNKLMVNQCSVSQLVEYKHKGSTTTPNPLPIQGDQHCGCFQPPNFQMKITPLHPRLDLHSLYRDSQCMSSIALCNTTVYTVNPVFFVASLFCKSPLKPVSWNVFPQMSDCVINY